MKPPKVVEALCRDRAHKFLSTETFLRSFAADVIATYDREYVEPIVEALKRAIKDDAELGMTTATFNAASTALLRYQSMKDEGKEQP